MAAAAAIDYASLQEIREESGRQQVKIGERLTGTANGSNTSFYVARTYVVDQDYSDTLTGADVVVYDDGAAVAVTSVNATTGEIVLTAAPASNSVMTANYAFSNLSDASVTKRRNAAISFVQNKLAGIIDYASWDAADVPAEIKTIVLMYASGLILIRDHGSSADTGETSKDGYKRLQWAKSALADYIATSADNAGSSASVSVSGTSDGNIYERETNLTDNFNDTVSTDEAFMRGD